MKRTKEKNFKTNFIYLFFYLEDKELLWDTFTDENLKLLKRIYFYQTTTEPMDYNKKVFNSLIRKDEHFIIEYLTFKFKKYKKNEYLSIHNERGNFKMLWDLDNYDVIITRIIEFCKKKLSFPVLGGEYYTVFFKNVPFSEKIEAYIKNYIDKNKNKIINLNIIFDIITSCYPDKRIYFLTYLLETNVNFKDFENLFLEKSGWSSEDGSFVNVYEKCKLFWMDVESLLYRVNMKSHLPYVKKKIEEYNSMINYELRRNFAEID